MKFRLFSIPITVHWSFFLVAAILGLNRRAVPWFLFTFIAVALVSILIHELGHALAFRRFGYRPSIFLDMMGGQTRTELTSSLPPQRELIITLAGPAAGLTTVAAVWLLTFLFPGLNSTPILGVVLRDLLWVNLAWSVFNLMPILPLDGGRALLARLKISTPAKAEIIAHTVSAATAVVVAIIALLTGMIFAALFAGWFGVHSIQMLQQLKKGNDVRTD